MEQRHREGCKRREKQIQEAADQMDRAQQKKDLAQECQYQHCMLVKEQNQKPNKLVKNIGDVS